MATVLTQDAVLHFLQSSGGSVKNSDLLLHFRAFIRDHADRDRNRDLFKKFVNSVATVKQTDGVSYVILRKKFRGHVPGGGTGGDTGGGRSSEPAAERRWAGREEAGPAPPGEAAKKTILPAAGIVLNNNKVKESEQRVSSTPGPAGRPGPDPRPGPGPAERPESRAAGRPGPGPGPGPEDRPGPGPAGRPGPAERPEPARGREPGPAERPESRAAGRPGPGPAGRPAAGPVPEQKTSGQDEPAPPYQDFQGRQQRTDPVPLHGSTAGPPAVHQPRELDQRVPESLRGKPPGTAPQNFQDPSHQNLHYPPHQNIRDRSPRNYRDPPLQNFPDFSPQNFQDSVQNLHYPSHQNLRDPSPQNFRDPSPSPQNFRDFSPSPQNFQNPSLQNFRDPSPSPQNFRDLSPSPQNFQNPSLQNFRDPSPQNPSLQNFQNPSLQKLENPSHRTLPEPSQQAQIAQRRVRHRQSYKTAVSYDEDEEEEEVSRRQQVPSGPVPPGSAPLHDPRRTTSASSPARHSVVSSSSSSSSERTLPMIYIQDVEDQTLTPEDPDRGSEPGAAPRGQWARPAWEPGAVPGGFTSRRSLPLEAECYHGAEAAVHHGYQRASGWSGSAEDLQARAGDRAVWAGNQAARHETAMQHAGSETAVPWRQSTGDLYDEPPTRRSTDRLHMDQGFRARIMPWHLSTGDLYDDHGEAESSEGSVSSPQLRLSGRLRNRMCRSLGADLDQLIHDEASGGLGDGGGGGGRGAAESRGGGGGSEAARLVRLHRISSSLSLRYLSSSSLSSCSTPPRCHSLADLTEAEDRKGRRRSLPATSPAHSSAHNMDQESRGRQSLVPLEPREHAWLVKAAAGAWPDIYSLFREDPSLLNRQDFISGFTVLHWIAKHGDHRVLNTLWYGVDKAGMTFDVDAKSTSGQTALHLAAIHGNKNILRLLVTKFKASVRLRDTAGKKAWQYLSRSAPLEMFQLLGAPARAAVTGAGVAKADSTWDQQQQQRRRRHHLSMASSAQRPLKLAGGTKVKRSSSIAAFLKHKSLLRIYGHHADSPL
ncbi:ankyrin repeat domain-containing protein SOWAHB isoform X2 [Salarias fasciatus]|uniref:ankyrin repeat domain-containing protein SOWAHB isoform X2 n=1 Tax=Salarias fasciatus TaxID=181472 RepID=UPI001176F244|nr:ankyrin repeat domain-containing protein SOWAHB-like isoform X2 [Salarias fasciatus]